VFIFIIIEYKLNNLKSQKLSEIRTIFHPL
jgi:hypothetical protein